MPKATTTEASTPQRAVILARISDDRYGDERGVSGQVADGRRLARQLGWRVGPDATHVVVENSTSAYKRRRIRLPDGRVQLRTVRPGFRRVLDLLASGGADGLIALDLDRVARDPRDLEDLIDVIESKVPRIPVRSVTGSLALAHDGDVAMARVMVAMAHKSSRDTARRVSRARLRQANEGRFGGGVRPYGHEVDGTVRGDEAEVIQKAAEAVLSGGALSAIVRDLNEREIPAPRGKRWAHKTLHELLTSPRIAGLMVHRREVVEGAPKFWQPILEREQWQAVRAILKDPARRSSTGPTPKYLLSYVARCGHDSHPEADRPVLIHGWSGKPQWRVASYKCEAGKSVHLSIASQLLDEYVERVVIERLSRPDAADLLVPRSDVDMAGLAREANSIRATITGLGDLFESGDMPAVEYRQRRGRLADKLASIEAEIAAVVGTSPLVGIAGRKDAGEVWAGLDLARKKAIIEALMTVVVLPATRRGRGFDPDRVRLEPLP